MWGGVLSTALLKFIAMKKGATVRLSKLGVSGSYSKKELTDILDEFISTYATTRVSLPALL